MLHTLRTLVAATIFSAALFTSCTKDDATPDAGEAKKLAKIEYADGSYEAISYGSNGSIETVTSFDNSGQGQTEKYHFAYSGSLLSEIKSDDASKFIYTYNGQQLVRIDYYNSAGENTTRYEYGYTNGKVTGVNVFMNTGGGLPANPNYRYEQEFLDNGNLKKMTLFFRTSGSNQFTKFSESVIEQYDDKYNTSILFENNPFLPLRLSQNNPLLEKHYNAAGNLTETVSHTYTYDDKGNPLTRKTTTQTPGTVDLVENAQFFY
jgi:hypothetical protein